MSYSIVTYGFGPNGSQYEIPVYGFFLSPYQAPKVNIAFVSTLTRSRSFLLNIETFREVDSSLIRGFSSFCSINTYRGSTSSIERSVELLGGLSLGVSTISEVETIPSFSIDCIEALSFLSSVAPTVLLYSSINTDRSFDSLVVRRIDFSEEL